MNENELELLKQEFSEDCIHLIELVGLDNFTCIARQFGGSYVYIPKMESLERPLRNKNIRDEFNGYNFTELAKKYDLTEIMIRKIVQDIIQKERNKPSEDQCSLFD